MKTFFLGIISFFGFLLNQATQPAETVTENPAQMIENAHGVHVSSHHKGQLVMSWVTKESNAEEGIVRFAISSDKGKNFNIQVSVFGSKGASTANGECPPKVAFKKDGSILVFFRLDEPTDENMHGGNIYVVASKDAGKTWTEKKPIVADASRSRAFLM